MPKLDLQIPEHWKGGYDLSNVIEFGSVRQFGISRKQEPGLTWQTFKWRMEDEYDSFEPWEILEELEVSIK